MSQERIEQVLSTLTGYATEYGLKIIGAILILTIGYTAARIAARAVGKALNKSKLDGSLVKFVSGLLRFGVIVVTWIAALDTFGIETTSFVAVLGAAGLAVGLTLQGSLSNFAAGVMLLFLKPFDEKDYIQVASVEGEVEEIGILTTILNTLDNRRIIIPNSMVFSNIIVSHTSNESRRVDLVVGISYQDDIDRAREVLLSIVACLMAATAGAQHGDEQDDRACPHAMSSHERAWSRPREAASSVRAGQRSALLSHPCH